MTKITLIEPKAPGKHTYSSVNMPRLGIPLLGTQLKQKGYDVKLLYGSGGELRVSDILGSDLVGISTTTSTCKEAYRIGRYVQQKGIPVVMGGPHATFLPEEALQYCDYVVRGEADSTFLDFVACIMAGHEPAEIPGVSFKRGNVFVHNPLPDEVNIDIAPIPDFNLFANLRKVSTYPVMTSRGCPFNCNFCSVTAMFGRKYRCRNSELVLQELAQYTDKKVFFCDDNFTANTGRAKALLREMIARGVTPSWWGAQVRTDIARDDELVALMREAGCGMVYVGMESINPETLKVYNKQQGVKDIEDCIKKCHQHKIMVHGMFVFGGENDTVQTIRDTVDFARDTRIDSVQFLVLTPIPGTPVYEKLEREGRLLTKDWNFYDGHHVVFQPALMSPLELQAETIAAFQKFYKIHNLFDNVSLTNKMSAGYRLVGWYLTRRWLQDNRWYFQMLEGLTQPDGSAISPSTDWVLNPGRNINISIIEQNGTFLVELKGNIDQLSSKRLFQTLNKNYPGQYRDWTIDIRQVKFGSEEALGKFMKNLNGLAVRARSVKIVSPFNGWLASVLEKSNGSLPYFEL
ncbi:MAG: radical SAM protein [Chitinophagales bacterium]